LTCYASTDEEDDPSVDSGNNLALNVADTEDTTPITVVID